jgi:hypothetical protein
MQPKIEQMVKDAIQPHLQPLLDKQVILEETVSQLQNSITNLKAKIDVTWSTKTLLCDFDRGEKVLGCFSSCLSEGE